MKKRVDRGMVLITVLWIVMVIAFISLSLAAAVRQEVTLTQDSFDSERAFFMAKTAADVIFQNLVKPGTLDDDSPVQQKDRTYIFPFDSGEVQVHFESNGGLIDINEADDKVLISLFHSVGLNDLLSNQLTDSILDWRDVDDVPRLYGSEIDDYGQVIPGERPLPRNAGFESLDELLLVRYVTPEIFYGHVELDNARKLYRRIRGIRELITIGSGSSQVDVNEASTDVLNALPAITPDIVAAVVSERDQKRFGSTENLLARIPQLHDSQTIKYMTTDATPPNSIASVASVKPSGATRTVHLDFGRERKKQILVTGPLIYKEIEVIKFGHWRY